MSPDTRIGCRVVECLGQINQRQPISSRDHNLAVPLREGLGMVGWMHRCRRTGANAPT